MIAADPQRYRPVMLVAFLEKLGFGAAAIALFAVQRIQLPVLIFGLIDLLLGVLFVIAYRRS